MMRRKLSTLVATVVVALLTVTVGQPHLSSARAPQPPAVPAAPLASDLPTPAPTVTGDTVVSYEVAAAAAALVPAVPAWGVQEASYPFASAACGSSNTAGDFIETVDGRSYRLHVPASYSPNVAAALVVNFHGYDRTAAEQEQYSGLIPISDSQGFILVTPEGSGSPQGWDIFGVYDENGVNDVAFTSALVQQIQGELCIDSARVYAIGISNGAEMASQVACDLPQTFAAVAAIAGVINQDCTTPVPVVTFQGTADENVLFEWAPGAVEAWATTNGCSLAGETTPVSDHVELVAYQGCTAGAEVAFYIIDGGGHTWPGAADDSGGVGPTTHEISASEIAWQFFAAHPRPS
jgi:polyhydroxybutyrate depolymerase